MHSCKVTVQFLLVLWAKTVNIVPSKINKITIVILYALLKKQLWWQSKYVCASGLTPTSNLVPAQINICADWWTTASTNVFSTDQLQSFKILKCKSKK